MVIIDPPPQIERPFRKIKFMDNLILSSSQCVLVNTLSDFLDNKTANVLLVFDYDCVHALRPLLADRASHVHFNQSGDDVDTSKIALRPGTSTAIWAWIRSLDTPMQQKCIVTCPNKFESFIMQTRLSDTPCYGRFAHHHLRGAEVNGQVLVHHDLRLEDLLGEFSRDVMVPLSMGDSKQILHVRIPVWINTPFDDPGQLYRTLGGMQALVYEVVNWLLGTPTTAHYADELLRETHATWMKNNMVFPPIDNPISKLGVRLKEFIVKCQNHGCDSKSIELVGGW